MAVLSLFATLPISVSIGVFEDAKLLWIPFVVFFLLFVVFSLSFLLVLLLISTFLSKKPATKPNAFYYFIVKCVTNYICVMARIKVKVTNGELIKKNRAYLLISNHRSKFDPMLELKVFSRCKPLMISKPENMKIPLAGAFINRCGFLAIDRERPSEAIKTINQASDFIKDYNYSIGICPEGTRNKTGTNLLPFKPGSFKIAMKSQAPIVLLTFNGTENIHKNFPFKKTVVVLDVLKIIEPEEYQNMKTVDIAKQAEKIMQENIDKYHKGNEQCEKMSA